MSSFRILIVDDQRDVRRMIADGLQMLGPGMDIVELPSGEEALLVAFRTQVHLLITDIKLPGISGLDLVRRIRKNNPDLKIIMITGMTDPQVKEQVDQIGADAFFYKPVGALKLLDAAQRCLGIVEGAPAGEEKEEVKADTALIAEITKPVAVKAQEVEKAGLLTTLGTLRDQLNAQAVAVIDAQGKAVSQVGDIGIINEPSPGFPLAYHASEQPGYIQLSESGYSLQPIVFFRSRSLPLCGSGWNFAGTPGCGRAGVPGVASKPRETDHLCGGGDSETL